MLQLVVPLLVVGVLGAGPAEPSPTTSTTLAIPDSPANGLSLQAEPNPPSLVGSTPMPTIPAPAVPGGRTALTAMVAGLAVLAGRARRIANAERTIRASLQDNLFSDVGREDLEGIATIVAGLDAGEASAVIARLSEDELGVWMRELDGWRGGIPRPHQVVLFRDLAIKLNPVQLHRLVVEGNKRELLDAIGSESPPEVRVRLATLLWASQDPSDDGWSEIIDLLAGVPVSVLETAMAQLSLEVLTEDLLGRHGVDPNGEPRLQFDAMSSFLGMAAQFTDPNRKGRIFVEMANQVVAKRSIPAVGGAEYEDVLGRLAALVRSDPGSIIGHMNHDIDPHGNVLSSWIREMIEADRIDELDVLLANLMGGERRLEHFTQPGSDQAFPYPNAANLGYYIGSYSIAIDAIADAAADKAGLVERLFTILTGIVPGPGSSRVRLPFGPLVDAHAESVIDGLRDDASSLRQTLWRLAKPRTASGQLWNGVGTTQFQDAWEEVVLVR